MTVRPPDPLDGLIEAYLNDALDAEGLARLEAELRASPEAARRFASAARWDSTIERAVRRSRSEQVVAPGSRPLAGRRPLSEHIWGPAVALVAHAALLVFLIRWVIFPSPPRRDDGGEADGVEIALERPAERTALEGRPGELPTPPVEVRAPPASAAATRPGESLDPVAVWMDPEDAAVSASRAGGEVALTGPHPLTERRTATARAAYLAAGGVVARQADEAAARAARWLAGRQSTDGAWREEGSDPQALTSLALLALLGRGDTHRSGPHAAVVRGALAFLTGTTGRPSDLRASALRLHAMADASAATRLPAVRAAMDLTVRQALSDQISNGGWGASSSADPVITAWMTWGLRLALAAGADEPAIHAAIARAADAMDRSLNPASGSLYYPSAGGVSPLRWSQIAGAVLTLQMAGDDAGTRALRGLKALDSMSPAWPRTGGESAGGEALLLATACRFNEGGPSWMKWYGALAASVLSRRDAGGVWSDSRGVASVRATALAILLLDTPCRYPPVSSWPVAVVPMFGNPVRLAFQGLDAFGLPEG